jgi:peptidoglycan/LPS O-acetylase OafA/YrhL
MEGLRGFAVFLVFLVHYATLVKPWILDNSAIHSFSNALHTIGNSGVDLFFVLSGYLIYGSLIFRPQNFFTFMSRRVQRIYPAFLVVFIFYVLLSFTFPAENKIPTSAYEGVIFITQNLLLLPGLFSVEPIITVAWSLSYEMFYYLTIPFIITVFSLRERSAAWRTAFFLTLAAVTTIYCAAYGGHIRLIMFIAGILLHEALNSQRILPSNSSAGLFALVFGLMSTMLPVAGSNGNALKIGVLFLSFFVLCLACFRNPSAWLAKIFSQTALRWLGNMSYSYYLLHGLALKAAFLALAVIVPTASDSAWLFWPLMPVMFALTVIPAAILFLAVEHPLSLSPQRAQ